MKMLSEPTLNRSTVTDPCDRCERNARVRAVLPTTGELLFCGDHLLEHLKRLRELAADIQRIR
jgi:hypothetical protein